MIPRRSGPTANALTSRHSHVHLTQRAAPNCRNRSDASVPSRLFPSLTFWRPQSDDVTKPRTRRELNSTLEQSYDGFILKHDLKHVLDLRERSAPHPWVLDLHQSSIDENVACWALLDHVGVHGSSVLKCHMTLMLWCLRADPPRVSGPFISFIWRRQLILYENVGGALRQSDGRR